MTNRPPAGKPGSATCTHDPSQPPAQPAPHSQGNGQTSEAAPPTPPPTPPTPMAAAVPLPLPAAARVPANEVGNGNRRAMVRPPSIGKQWEARAAELAEHFWERSVVRSDRWGVYTSLWSRTQTGGGWGNNWTAPRKDQIGKRLLTKKVLECHFAVAVLPPREHFLLNAPDDVIAEAMEDQAPTHIIGLHCIDEANTCRDGKIDIDWHGEGLAPPEVMAANQEATRGWYEKAKAMGFRPLLWDTNGKGGYRLELNFSTPVPSHVVYEFMKWFVSDYASYGMAEPPETFPKQPRLGPGCPLGNWCRLIGRHHTRDVWATVYDGQQWLEGNQAIDHILTTGSDSPDLIPAEVIARAAEILSAADAPRAPSAGDEGGDDHHAPDRGTGGPVAAPRPMPADKHGRLVERARRYLNKVPGAVSGQGGHKATFRVGCALVRNFGCLPREDLFTVFAEWNQEKCDPPWTAAELDHKLEGAFERTRYEGDDDIKIVLGKAGAKRQDDGGHDHANAGDDIREAVRRAIPPEAVKRLREEVGAEKEAERVAAEVRARCKKAAELLDPNRARLDALAWHVRQWVPGKKAPGCGQRHIGTNGVAIEPEPSGDDPIEDAIADTEAGGYSGDDGDSRDGDDKGWVAPLSLFKHIATRCKKWCDCLYCHVKNQKRWHAQMLEVLGLGRDKGRPDEADDRAAEVGCDGAVERALEGGADSFPKHLWSFWVGYVHHTYFPRVKKWIRKKKHLYRAFAQADGTYLVVATIKFPYRWHRVAAKTRPGKTRVVPSDWAEEVDSLTAAERVNGAIANIPKERRPWMTKWCVDLWTLPRVWVATVPGGKEVKNLKQRIARKKAACRAFPQPDGNFYVVSEIPFKLSVDGPEAEVVDGMVAAERSWAAMDHSRQVGNRKQPTTSLEQHVAKNGMVAPRHSVVCGSREWALDPMVGNFFGVSEDPFVEHAGDPSAVEYDFADLMVEKWGEGRNPEDQGVIIIEADVIPGLDGLHYIKRFKGATDPQEERQVLDQILNYRDWAWLIGLGMAEPREMTTKRPWFFAHTGACTVKDGVFVFDRDDPDSGRKRELLGLMDRLPAWRERHAKRLEQAESRRQRRQAAEARVARDQARWAMDRLDQAAAAARAKNSLSSTSKDSDPGG